MKYYFLILILRSKSEYKWDSNRSLWTNGTSSEEKFPVRKTFGASYKFDDPDLIVSAEIENSNAETTFVRFGTEYNIYPGLFVRGGLDTWNLSNSDFPARPSAGFSYFYTVDSFKLGVDYAFVIEPYSSSDQHIVGLTVNF